MAFTYSYSRSAATPLTLGHIQELVDENLASLIVDIHGSSYNSEDLYSCAECHTPVVDGAELDEAFHCGRCQADALVSAKYRGQEIADYRASVR